MVVVVVVVVFAFVALTICFTPPPSNQRRHRPDTARMLHYEKLDAYQISIQFLALALKLAAQIPKGYAFLADQLRRAAMSIPLNIAEGVGKPSLADRARFHAIARGSAMECGAILDVVMLLAEDVGEIVGEGKGLVVRLVEMLSRMCR